MAAGRKWTLMRGGTVVMVSKKKAARAVMSEKAYVKSGGLVCPVCRSNDIEAEKLSDEGGFASQEVHCNKCDSCWKDKYTLAGYDDLYVPRCLPGLREGR